MARDILFIRDVTKMYGDHKRDYWLMGMVQDIECELSKI